MMNYQTCDDFVSRNSQITAIVTNYDMISDRLPFLRLVKTLIDPSVEPECPLSEIPTQPEITIPFFECVQSRKLFIGPNPRHLIREEVDLRNMSALPRELRRTILPHVSEIQALRSLPESVRSHAQVAAARDVPSSTQVLKNA